MNPLLKTGLAPAFDRIRPEHVQPAIDELLVEARAAIDQIATMPAPHTYEWVMIPFDSAGTRLGEAMAMVTHLESVATTPALREAYNAVQTPVSEFRTSIPLNEALWNVIRKVHDAPGPVERRFLDKTVDAFRRNGAELDEAGKARLKEIDVELTHITTKFGENVVDVTKRFELVIEDESKLAGLPESARAAARESAKAKGKEGWRFTLQAPSYVAVMTYLDDPGIREQMYRAYNTRSTADPYDNRDLIVRILGLRRAKAELLDYNNFADYVLADRMAKTGAQAKAFLQDLHRKSQRAFDADNVTLETFAGGTLNAWDIGYWSEKQRQALYQFDEEALRPWFPVARVVEGMYRIFERVLGICIVEKTRVPVWDPEVRYFEIRDATTEALLGAFYSDWYPRETKRGGAWMESLVTGGPAGIGVDHDFDPHLGVICGNLTPPVGNKPALLTHREVETIFHEFGHLLHHCLSTVAVRSLAGTHVAWDFVELPSQIMENWCWEREALDEFARHDETGAPIPDELFAALIRARNFRAAAAQMRQLSFGLTDLALHMEYDAARDGDVIAYARERLQPFNAAPLPDDYAMIAAFTHLFSDPEGYGAGYYSYKWAEVLDADAFTRFRQEGIFSESTGRAFREGILSRGDSADPAELFRAFMGRDPDAGALLRRQGLAT